MAIIKNVETLMSKQTWESPDHKIKGYAITLDVNGEEFTANTYSGQIAKVGFKGDVETYEKGDYTYVRQYKDESSNTSYKGQHQGKPQDSPYTMYLSYAKDVAVALMNTTGAVDEKQFNKILDTVAKGGKVLFASRPDAEPAESEAAELAAKANEIFSEDEMPKDFLE